MIHLYNCTLILVRRHAIGLATAQIFIAGFSWEFPASLAKNATSRCCLARPPALTVPVTRVLLSVTLVLADFETGSWVWLPPDMARGMVKELKWLLLAGEASSYLFSPSSPPSPFPPLTRFIAPAVKFGDYCNLLMFKLSIECSVVTVLYEDL